MVTGRSSGLEKVLLLQFLKVHFWEAKLTGETETESSSNGILQAEYPSCQPTDSISTLTTNVHEV